MTASPIVVTIPGTPAKALSPNGRANRYVKNRAAQQLKADAFRATQDAIGAPRNPVPALTLPLTIHVVIAWESRRECDPDNAWASLKYAIDGMSLALCIDDRHVIPGTIQQERDPDKRGYIKIAIEEGDA